MVDKYIQSNWERHLWFFYFNAYMLFVLSSLHLFTVVNLKKKIGALLFVHLYIHDEIAIGAVIIYSLFS